MVKEIPLTQGYVALVDDADYGFLMQFKWSVIRCKGRLYARHGMQVDGQFFDIKMHRLIVAAPTGVDVDHWNGNGLDNRRENLRRCSQRQNIANSRPKGRPFKGICKVSARTYRALIVDRGKQIALGTYDSAAEAAKVYDAAAKRIYGEFALGNFPDIDPAADEIAARVLAGGNPPDRSHMKKSSRLLTDAQVIEIRERYALGGVFLKDLAVEYGVKPATVQHMISGRTFSDVGEPVSAERRKQLRSQHSHFRKLHSRPMRRKLTPEQVQSIRARYQPRVVTAGHLAEEFNVSKACIYSVVNGYSWKDEAAA